MPPFRRRYQYPQQNRFSDSDEIHPSLSDRAIEMSFEEDHRDLDAFEGEIDADPDSAPINPSRHLHLYHPGVGFRPHRRRR